ncbi:synaptic vesicle glycoprotein 2C-like isoform X1 [Onthophagus taurus]|uniref:synaptic vesicle glycoprotein 2C-like isoform X1 n=1 Tax=Onthophagus taurus TaxID=166361 RepID=UPI0039BDAAA7
MTSKTINKELINYEEPVDFETAISEAHFGKFNIFLILLIIASYFAINFDLTTMSYVIPIARCDLQITLEQAGLLNSITYLGMIPSAFIWGFMADTIGRKKIIVSCFAINAFFIILTGISQTYKMLVVLKFFSGFIISGPIGTLTSVLSEYHSSQYRAQVVLLIGLVYAAGNMVVPLLAWLIIPLNWNVKFLNGTLKSWNFFLMISSFPCIISSIGHFFIPENPKYLMTAGKNEEALRVFQKVFCLNTGKSPENYPVKKLINEDKRVESTSSIQALKNGVQQIKPLFQRDYLWNFLLIGLIQVGFVACMNSLRTWLPQIFTILTDYKTNNPNSDADFCKMIQNFTNINSTAELDNCNENPDSSVYINSSIIFTSTILAFLIIELTINKLGKKPILIVIGVISGLAGFFIYFSVNIAMMTALAAINTGLGTVCTDVLMTISVDVFPTSLRTVGLAIIFTMARVGILSGNMLFPVLLKIGCLPPFLTIGCTILICSMLVFLLPNTDNKALE